MKRPSKIQRFNIFWGYALLLPTIIGLGLFYIYPFFENIYNSFTTISFVGEKTWVGLANYKVFLEDPRILNSFLYTFRYVFITVPLVVALSLIVAVFLNSNIRGVNFYRLIFYLPVIAMPVAMATVWKSIFHTDFGLINFLLTFIGFEPLAWLRDKDTFSFTLIIVSVWGRVGYNVLILLAGLQNIPKMYYEASTLDGAGPIKTFFSITCPLLSPTIFFIVVTNTIAYLQVFDQIFTLVPMQSAVGEANTSVIVLFYQYAFLFDQKGLASVVSVLFFFVILFITGIQFWLQKKWVYYENE
ncbi:MAG: carbohydrate ABC transporter permease [Brevinema sp.]